MNCKQAVADKFPSLSSIEISMGMSNDFEQAVSCVYSLLFPKPVSIGIRNLVQ